MLRSLQIKGYRGFTDFWMRGLGRVNLLVGKNNSGKTSVLEAIHLLATGGDPFALWQIMSRRSEQLPEDGSRPDREMDICRLFAGHEIGPESKFEIHARNEAEDRSIVFRIGERKEMEVPERDEEAEPPIGPRLALYLSGSPRPRVPAIPVTRRGGLRVNDIAFRRVRVRSQENVQFITTDSLSGDALTTLWAGIALTQREEFVLNVLRYIEPGIERIASIGPSRRYDEGTRGGFIVKLRDFDQPIPIGSMGEGIWRLLAIAIAISGCKGGYLLIDEIDTGLHYTVLEDLWRLVYEAARELDVQVFATTHSHDGVESLAAVCRADVETESEVSIQRIERARSSSVRYSEAEIRVAAERDIEVR